MFMMQNFIAALINVAVINATTWSLLKLFAVI